MVNFKAISGVDLLKIKDKTKYVIKPLITEKSIVMFTGQTGSTKTIQALYKAICIARGISYFRFKVKQHNVLMILAETSNVWNKVYWCISGW